VFACRESRSVTNERWFDKMAKQMAKTISLGQLSSLISVLLTNAHLDNLPREDAQLIIDSPALVGSRFDDFLKSTAEKLRKFKNSIFEYVDRVVIPATTGKFIARERFVIGTSPDAPAKISGFGGKFKMWFLEGDGKIEDSIGEKTLCYQKLRRSSRDRSIIAELGGEELAETTLSDMFFFIKKQKNDEHGALLHNGWVNIFHIKDSVGVLRNVDVCCSGDGWFVDAYSVEVPIVWSGGSHVFSRISAP